MRAGHPGARWQWSAKDKVISSFDRETAAMLTTAEGVGYHRQYEIMNYKHMHIEQKMKLCKLNKYLNLFAITVCVHVMWLFFCSMNVHMWRHCTSSHNLAAQVWPRVRISNQLVQPCIKVSLPPHSKSGTERVNSKSAFVDNGMSNCSSPADTHEGSLEPSVCPTIKKITSPSLHYE